MILFKKADDLRNYLDKQVKKGKTIGFVPTMGALHEGHISLAKTCKNENDLALISIFINPTQFNDPKDFEKYPVTTGEDVYLLEKAETDLIFLPSVHEIYPQGTIAQTHYDLGNIGEVLEGEFRPGHFQGVCQVMNRLMEIVKPNKLYLGQKDYQQCMIIKRLLSLEGYDKTTKLVISPTLREPDGLAMSSRNRRLNAEQREKANTIYKVLSFIKTNYHDRTSSGLIKEGEKMLGKNGFKVDYVAIVDGHTLEPVENQNDTDQPVALIAAFLGDVRLIDNMLLNKVVST